MSDTQCYSHQHASNFKLAGMKDHLKELLDEWGLLSQVRHALHQNFSLEKALSTEEELFSYRIIVNYRFQTCAGAVRFSKKNIEIHKALLDKIREKERDNTVLHEVAHVLCYILYGHKGHGKQWKEMMRHLQIDDNRCHNYDFLASKRTRPFIYTCMDCGTHISRTRKLHRTGLLRLWHHQKCRHMTHKGRFSFTDNTKGKA